MSKEVYVLQKNVHFGSLKFSVNKGAKIIIDKENNKAIVNDREYENVYEIDLCIRKGFIVPFVEENQEEIPSETVSSENKMEIEKSDVDNVQKNINNSSQNSFVQKNEKVKMEVIRENEAEEESRGLKVITNDAAKGVEVDNRGIMEIINSDEGEIVAKINTVKSKPKGVPDTGTLSVTSTDSDDLAAINGEQGRVVKMIGKSDNTKEITSGNKLTAKRASKSSADKAKANAEARKKASEARRAKESKETK